jgi:ABC-type molybdenum transport system ATPase subunit/photorepair protein PhrA
MTVWEAIGTGFDGGFVPYGKERVGVGVDRRLDEEDTIWRVERVKEVLRALGPTAWGSRAEDYGARQFVDISAGEQNMVLLMRALVGRPQLVLLDEVWNGMDDRMVKAAKRYLTDGNGVGGDQAVVVISCWEEEVPWGRENGVKRFRLEKGFGSEV